MVIYTAKAKIFTPAILEDVDYVLERDTAFDRHEVAYSWSTITDLVRVWDNATETIIGWIDLEHGIWVPNGD